MKISTKGRYALRVLIDLAENDNGAYIPMKVVAKRQGLPIKYLEHILPALTQNHIVDSVHGKGGGYRLLKKPKEYTVLEVLTASEGSLATVACLSEDAEKCPREDGCKTLPMWKKYDTMIHDFFDGITIADLVEGNL